MNRTLQRELGRKLRDFDYETGGNGELLFPKTNVVVAGMFYIENLTRGDGPVYAQNRVVNQGLDYLASVALHDTAKVATWYIAPFSANVTPQATLTAEQFAGTTSEFTNYTEGTRPAFAASAAVTGGVVDNFGAKAEITVGSGGQDTIFGLGLLSASGKSATTGVLFSATRLPSARPGLVEDDIIALGYSLTISDAT